MRRKTTVGEVDAEVLAYTAGQDRVLDLALVEADCFGTAAHVSMLARLPVKPGAAFGEVSKAGIPFAKGNPKFKAAINQALASLKADGSFAKISNKWFERDVSLPPHGR